MLLSTFGYLHFLIVIEQQVSSRAVKRIAENENQISGNVVLRVPVSLPYPSYDNEYKTASGEIMVDGVLYRFVKQKMYRDTLYLVCSRDMATTEARNAISHYSTTFADTYQQKANAPHKATSIFPVFCDYIDSSSIANLMRAASRLRRESGERNYHFSSIASVFHPPCAICTSQS
jgi:hypothetical protein